MIQLMNEKDILLGLQSRQGTPRNGQEDAAQEVTATINTPTSLKARIAREKTLSSDDIRDMDDATFIASLHSSQDK